jgi:hypothetical protein
MSRSLSPCPAEVQVERLIAEADHITLSCARVSSGGSLSGVYPSVLSITFEASLPPLATKLLRPCQGWIRMSSRSDWRRSHRWIAGWFTWNSGGPKAVTIAVNSGANCRTRERILPRSRCAVGSASAWECEGVLSRVRSLRLGNDPVLGKSAPSCSTSSTTHLHSNKPSRSACAPFLPTSPTVELAKQFWRVLREHDASAWSPWQKAARQSPLHHFAVQLQRDEAAVQAALTLPWSTGPVEGHIHRLKLIKRQMYGRAKLDLLRIRVLHAA